MGEEPNSIGIVEEDLAPISWDACKFSWVCILVRVCDEQGLVWTTNGEISCEIEVKSETLCEKKVGSVGIDEYTILRCHKEMREQCPW